MGLVLFQRNNEKKNQIMSSSTDTPPVLDHEPSRFGRVSVFVIDDHESTPRIAQIGVAILSKTNNNNSGESHSSFRVLSLGLPFHSMNLLPVPSVRIHVPLSPPEASLSKRQAKKMKKWSYQQIKN